MSVASRLVMLWACAGMAMAAQAQTAAPQALTPQQQADAVRRALLSESLKKPLRVVSNAWIDEQGRLYENAQFTSDMRVRGVRVSSYLQQNDEAQAQLELHTNADDLADCATARSVWSRPAQIEVKVDGAFTAGEQALASALVTELGAVVREPDARRPWLARDRGWQPASRYETFLVGPAAPVEPWLLQLSLKPLRQAAAAADPGASARAALERWGAVPSQTPWTVRLELRWVDRHHPERSRIWSEDVRVQAPHALTQAQEAVAQARIDLHAAMGRAVQRMERTLSCEPLVVSLTQSDAGWELPLGTDSGVRAGDRLVVMDRAQLPQRVLEPQALNSLGIAEVHSVQSRSARLQWLGGPPPGAIRDGVALPLSVGSRL